jgi:hypothetical protein
MAERTDGVRNRSNCAEPQSYPQILKFETPDIEEIAKAIWQRQHDALDSKSVARDWRDHAVPSRFWDEFLLDARAVLAFLYREHEKYQKKREKPQSF